MLGTFLSAYELGCRVSEGQEFGCFDCSQGVGFRVQGLGFREASSLNTESHGQKSSNPSFLRCSEPPALWRSDAMSQLAPPNWYGFRAFAVQDQGDYGLSDAA